MSEHIYGWKPQLPDQRDFKFALSAPTVGLPELVDLRNYMPPVYDQGELGSCTANSIAANVWMRKTMQRGDTAVLEPSRLFIYYNERVIDHSVRTDAGSTIRTSMKAVANYGACSEEEWPYDISKFKKKPSKLNYTEGVSYGVVQSYEAVNQNLNSLQTALYNKYPVCIGISVYESFESQESARGGVIRNPLRTEKLLGGHAVLLVGYDNTRKCFIFRNSWGTSWGDKGYGYIPYEYILNPNLASDFWIIKVA